MDPVGRSNVFANSNSQKKLVISCRLPPSMQKKRSILTVGVPESTQTSQRPLTCQCSIHSPHLIRWQNKRLPSGTKDSILPNNPSAIWLGCSNGHSLVPMPSSVSTATESTGQALNKKQTAEVTILEETWTRLLFTSFLL